MFQHPWQTGTTIVTTVVIWYLWKRICENTENLEALDGTVDVNTCSVNQHKEVVESVSLNSAQLQSTVDGLSGNYDRLESTVTATQRDVDNAVRHTLGVSEKVNVITAKEKISNSRFASIESNLEGLNKDNLDIRANMGNLGKTVGKWQISNKNGIKGLDDAVAEIGARVTTLEGLPTAQELMQGKTAETIMETVKADPSTVLMKQQIGILGKTLKSILQDHPNLSDNLLELENMVLETTIETSNLEAVGEGIAPFLDILT
jgi:chromosome segregation ATPase